MHAPTRGSQPSSSGRAAGLRAFKAGRCSSGAPDKCAHPRWRRQQRPRPSHVCAAVQEAQAPAKKGKGKKSQGKGGNKGAGDNADQGEVQKQEDYTNDVEGAGEYRIGVSSGFKLFKVSKTFKNNELLREVTWECKKGERVGLIGVNGAGKTTQMQILLGNIEPDSGEVIRARSSQNVAYLNQEFDIEPERTVREELAAAFHAGMRNAERTEQIQKELEDCTDDMDRMSALLDELNKLSGEAQDLDMSKIDGLIDKMMPELGFSPEDNDRKVREYSGGWQMRMCLGKILLQDPDVLVLDEPTNHLDLDAIEWLERYVSELEIPTVVISHDREFLDQVCNKIVETERGVATTYQGNYTAAMQAKRLAIAQQWSQYEKWQKEVDKQKDIVRRLSGGGQSGRAQTAEKEIAKLNAERVEKPFETRKRMFRFPPVANMGERVATIERLSHGYNGRPLFEDTSLDIGKGDRIAIIGPNGAGKSTLLRLLMGTEAAQQGTVRLGEHSIVPNYYQQNQAEALDLNLTVHDTLANAAEKASDDDIKALLGKMLFSRASYDKKVRVLSGGEKARLALAKFMLTKGTLLVLDEPTNHLDIPSKEMLEEAVKHFEGSVIAVSHDRYFLRQVANRVVLVQHHKLNDYVGGYDYYLECNDDERAKMEVKAERAKKLRQETTKSKSRRSKVEKKAIEKGRISADAAIA